jgi:ribosome-associated protein
MNKNFSPEFEFQTSRSSGAGGQNVNKVSSKVELRFHIQNSQLLDETEKAKLTEKLANKINQDGFLIITAQETRSQLKNKELAIQKFYKLVEKAFFVPKKRQPTKIPQAVKAQRLETKKIDAEKKANRRKIDF